VRAIVTACAVRTIPLSIEINIGAGALALAYCLYIFNLLGGQTSLHIHPYLIVRRRTGRLDRIDLKTSSPVIDLGYTLDDDDDDIQHLMNIDWAIVHD
jgi:hypothetical protein